MRRLPQAMGLLPVDKPVGPTSHDIVNRARRALEVRRIGHTGTLDPFASGLLLLCVGQATRLAEYLDTLHKSYVATVILGRSTSTDDHLGETLEESDAWRALDRSEVEEALLRFRGTIAQVPPRYSAKKVEGEAMYRRARRGETVNLPPVDVRIEEVELLEMTLPEVRFRVRCSTGTYVRALARDLGEALRVGGHLSRLRRLAIGPFSVDDALPAVQLHDAGRVEACWISPLAALAHLPMVEIGEEAVSGLVHGRPVKPDPVETNPPGESSTGLASSVASPGASGTENAEESPVAVVHHGALVAVGFMRDQLLHPRKVFARG